MRSWRTNRRVEGAITVLGMGLIGVAVSQLRQGGRPLTALSWAALLLLASFLGLLAMWAGWAAADRRQEDDDSQSARRRAGACRTCGYDLAGLAGGPCPECGAAAPAGDGASSA